MNYWVNELLKKYLLFLSMLKTVVLLNIFVETRDATIPFFQIRSDPIQKILSISDPIRF